MNQPVNTSRRMWAAFSGTLALSAAITIGLVKIADAQFTSPTCVPPTCSPTVIQNTPAASTAQAASINVSGGIKGDGANVSNLNASNLASGTVPDARLSINIPTIAANNSFTGINTYTNAISMGNFKPIGFINTTGTANYGQIFMDNAAGAYAGANGLVFYLNGAGRMDINAATGNVGIGTATPGAYKLNVNGDTNITGNTNVTGNTVVGGNMNVTGTVTGNGSGLTNVAASGLAAGTYANAYTFNNAGNSFTGTHIGSGASLTSLNASNISSGTLADARLSANVPLLNANNTFTGNNTFNSMTSFGSGTIVLGAAQNTIYGAAASTSSGNLLLLQTGNGGVFTNRFSVNAAGNVTTPGSVTAASFSGNGSGLTNVTASSASGLAGGTYSNAYTFNNAGNVFTGNGAAITNVTAAGLAGGTYANAYTFNNAANSFTGNGAGLTSLNAGNISSGSLAWARIANATCPASQYLNNVTGGVWGCASVVASGLAAGTYSNAYTFNNAGNVYSGNGAALTGVTAASASGLTAGTYSNAYTFNNAANSFTGNGAGLTSLNASNISSGSLAWARIANAACPGGQYLNNVTTGVWGCATPVAVEADTLQTVTNRGRTTTLTIAVGGAALDNTAGLNANGTNYGVHGNSTAGGVGVYGSSPSGSGMGVDGSGATYGVHGSSGIYGVYGTSSGGGVGVFGGSNTAGGSGVQGQGASYGVYGVGLGSGTGVYGSGDYGIYGNGGSYGVYGSGTVGGFFSGTNQGVYGTSSNYGGYFVANDYGVYANGVTGGIFATGSTYSVYGSGGIMFQDGELRIQNQSGQFSHFNFQDTNANYLRGATTIDNYVNPSDIRLKDLHGSWDRGLDDLLKLQTVRFTYKKGMGETVPADGRLRIGVVAQEVEKSIPEAVSKNAEGYLQVNNDPIFWTMVNSIKEMQQEIEDLRAQVQELKK